MPIGPQQKRHSTKPAWRWRVIESRAFAGVWFGLYLAAGIPGVGRATRKLMRNQYDN